MLGTVDLNQLAVGLAPQPRLMERPSLLRLFDGRPIAWCRIDAAPPVLIRSSNRRTWRVLSSSTCAADTNVMRPAITFDKTSIRCRSRSLIAINPIRNLPGHQNPGRVTFQ